MPADDLALPGTPPPVLSSVWEALSPPERRAFRPHLLGGTSADWLQSVLMGAGFNLSATTIKKYRRSLNERPD